MKRLNTTHTIPKLSALFGLMLSLSTTASLAEDPQWSYKDQALPAGWASLMSDESPPPKNFPYAECANGHSQTPVEISDSSQERILNVPSIKWKTFQADFYNNGHSVQVQPTEDADESGTLWVGKDIYPLVQLHVHSPAEHVLSGLRYPVEIHFVHIRDDGRMAVIGVLASVGAANAEFQKILDNTPNTPGVPTHNETQIPFNAKKLLPEGPKTFFTYAGSLTTPPCTEGVSWFLYTRPITISAEQLASLESFYKGNFRVLQPLDDRSIVRHR